MISYLVIKGLIESLQNEEYAECTLEAMIMVGTLFIDICLLPIEIIAAFIVFIIKKLTNKKEK